MQWLQVVTYVFWMNSRGKTMEAFSSSAPSALVVSCFGLLLMAIIIGLLINKLTIPSLDYLRQQAEKINARKLLIVYILSTVFLTSIRFLFGNAGGADQFLVVISSLKWVFFMAYGFIVWLRKKNVLIFILIIGYEFAISLTSYFSSFKEVLLYAIIVALTFVTKVKTRQVIYGLLVAGVLGVLLLTWTAIKSDYRKFVNKGVQAQVVTVERSEAIGKMQSEVKELTWKHYEFASNMVLYRIQYLYNLSLAMERVPYLIPYQNGAVWEENISFVITPRALFPQKGIYNASAKARTFTGLNYSGIKEGSSFSLGYFADCYVDFGYIGMFLPIGLIGLFVGLIYRVFYKMENLNILLRFATINICLYNFTSFEADGLFLFGRLLTTFIIYWVLARTLFPWMQKWLYKKPT
ncbi:MAG: hypothetical protein J7497_02795 [Chitinophagaceae bacterium]|nr:hypothetical protein [Chitinophagaceae bacterium]